MFRHVDLDGGDLGYPDIVIELADLPLFVDMASRVLSQAIEFVNKSGDKRNVVSFGFRIYHTHSQLINTVLNSIKLPDNVQFYEVDGRKVFEMRGPSGGVVSSLACYLMEKR